MRPISLITAILVSVALYFLVMERDALHAMALGSKDDPRETEAQTPADGATDTATDTATDATTATTTGTGADAGADMAADAAQTDTPAGAMRVVAMASTAQEVDSAVVLRGETQAARQVDVRAETTGRIVSPPLRAGATVAAGDVLCQIDLGTRNAALAQADAALETAQVELNQAEKLSKDGYASQTRLTAAKAGVESAQANLEVAKTEITRVTMTAPFAGLLDSDTAELGALLQQGGICATVLQLDPIKLVAYVPETEIARVEIGARAGARLTTGETVQGRVRFLSRAADVQTRTFKVEIDVANPDLTIRSGQTAEIIIAAPGSKGHLLPQSALTLNDQGALGVRVVENGNTAGFIAVELLRDTADGVWVTGLPDSVNVITVGQEYVTDGVPITPVYAKDAQ